MEKFTEILLSHIDFVALALVLLGGIFSKHFLSGWKVAVAWKTFIMGTLFLVVYSLIQVATGKFVIKDMDKLFFTYCVATSLYELILRYIFDALFKKLGINVDEATYIK